MRGSERGLFSTKRCPSRTGTVRASRPQQIKVLCGTRGQRSATPRLSLPETKAAGKYLPNLVTYHVILDQLFCHEIGIVVGHAPEVVADAPPGDDGVVERIPEDGARKRP